MDHEDETETPPLEFRMHVVCAVQQQTLIEWRFPCFSNDALGQREGDPAAGGCFG
jgi:hypothetical protein